ncbi:hypothetical protein DSO57_1022080 [Entomophthora muscae]|uniref:Uncharacterized protein n=1 Tax=Entomophthora muscae TaxID=34485 RepID=A0ACC2TQU5_9FUNG|nr:hypothetical protein DSO57_1022080 [Entomophthora muscae]
MNPFALLEEINLEYKSGSDINITEMPHVEHEVVDPYPEKLIIISPHTDHSHLDRAGASSPGHKLTPLFLRCEDCEAAP